MPLAKFTGPDSMLLGGDFIYQRIHVMKNTPLHVEAHNEIVIRALLSLYGNSYKLSCEQLRSEIDKLAKVSNYANCSTMMILFVLPSQKGIRDTDTVDWILSYEEQLLYPGYTLWHKPMKAVITRYEYPFAEFPTAVSLAAHNYALGYAARQGADIAVTQNHGRVITGAGPLPFFAVSRDRVFITPLEEGALDSVMRRLGLVACEKAGFKIVEQPIDTLSLVEFEEFFIVNIQGVLSIGTLNNRPYPSSAAKVIAEQMSTLTDESLLIDEMFL